MASSFANGQENEYYSKSNINNDNLPHFIPAAAATLLPLDQNDSLKNKIGFADFEPANFTMYVHNKFF